MSEETTLGSDQTAIADPEPTTETPSAAPSSEAAETQDKPPEGEPASPAEPEAPKEGEKEGEAPDVLKAGDEPAPKAPETYELKAPEGHKELDEALLDTYTEVARELDLPNEGAQKILDKVLPALQEQQNAVMQAARTEWVKTTRTDKELGGENLKANLSVANRALERFGSPALTQFLNDSGLSEHPEVIRLCFKAGSQISEDKAPVQSGGEATNEVNLDDPAYVLEKLYGKAPTE